MLDTKFRYLRVNEWLAAMNGMPVEQHIGRTVREIVPEVADATEAVYRQVIATGQPVLALEVDGATGAQPGVKRTWVRSWVPLKEADGLVTAVSVVVEEVTERKRMLQALGESEAKYRRLYESMTDAFAKVDMTRANRRVQPGLSGPVGLHGRRTEATDVR